jgi:hypothetical protein
MCQFSLIKLFARNERNKKIEFLKDKSRHLRMKFKIFESRSKLNDFNQKLIKRKSSDSLVIIS